jgi:hypothetical protein
VEDGSFIVLLAPTGRRSSDRHVRRGKPPSAPSGRKERARTDPRVSLARLSAGRAAPAATFLRSFRATYAPPPARINAPNALDVDGADVRRDIDHTDREIDRLVYDLYGLTDDEIRIVEEASSSEGGGR